MSGQELEQQIDNSEMLRRIRYLETSWVQDDPVGFRDLERQVIGIISDLIKQREGLDPRPIIYRASAAGVDAVVELGGAGTIVEVSRARVGLDKVPLLTNYVLGLQNANRLIVFSPDGVDTDALRQALESAPVELEIFDFARLENWAAQNSDEPVADTDKKRFTLYRTIAKKLIDAVNSDPHVLLGLEWYYVEELVAETLRGICGEVEAIRTPPARDGGKDVIVRYRVEFNREVYYVEVKHWSSPVGRGVVKKFVDVVIDDNVQAGLILATSGFTSTAFSGLTVAAVEKVRGGTMGKIIEMCNVYYRVRSGLWRPIEDLRGYLHSDPGILKA